MAVSMGWPLGEAGSLAEGLPGWPREEHSEGMEKRSVHVCACDVCTRCVMCVCTSMYGNVHVNVCMYAHVCTRCVHVICIHVWCVCACVCTYACVTCVVCFGMCDYVCV